MSAQQFLLALSSGEHPAKPITALRKEARDIAKHYPLEVDYRWLENTREKEGVECTTNT